MKRFVVIKRLSGIFKVVFYEDLPSWEVKEGEGTYEIDMELYSLVYNLLLAVGKDSRTRDMMNDFLEDIFLEFLRAAKTLDIYKE